MQKIATTFSYVSSISMGYIHECYTSSRSSSWSRLYGESTIDQESVPEVCEKLFQVTEKLIMGQTEIGGLTTIDCKRTSVEIDDSTMSQSD